MKGEDCLLHCTPAERDAVLRALHQVLDAESDVVFAYLHGSFAGEGPFRDVDIAAYFDPVGTEGVSLRAIELSARAEAALARELDGAALPVDVRALNEAPLGFSYQALRGGRLLMSRDERFRIEWVARTVGWYLDLKPLRERALKEAMTA